MIVLRCTARLQERLKLPKLAEPGPSTTALGDWYGNVFHIGRQPRCEGKITEGVPAN